MASAAFPSRPATPAQAVNLFWRVGGVAFSLLAGVGILLVAIGQPALLGGFLAFDVGHNLLHVALAALAIPLGFGDAPPALAKRLAKVVGVLLLALALVGFASADLFGLGPPLGLRLEMGENVLHLLLGAWGAYAGFRG